MDQQIELPEFLRFNKYGAILSPEDRKRVAESRGVCITCGRTTHRVTAFRSVPLDSKDARRGICLVCHPEERGRETAEEKEAEMDKSGKRWRNKGKMSRMKEMRDVTRSIAKSVVRAASDMDGLRNSNPDATSSVIDGSRSSHPDSVPEDGLLLEKQSEHSFATLSASTYDAWDILGEMRSHPDNVRLLARKCHELRSVGCIAQGSMYEVVEVMQRFPLEREMQYAGIGSLWSLMVEGGDDVKMEAMDAQADEVILQAVRDLPDDDGVVSWGMGALSSLAEGLGCRARLLEDNLNFVQEIESVLRICHHRESESTLYWTLRCLSSLLAVYKEDEEYVSQGSFEDDNEMLEDLEALDDYVEAILKGQIVQYVFLAMNEPGTHALTLQMAFEFLARLFSNNKFCPDQENHPILIDVCEKVVAVGRDCMFPTLQNLACAFLCFILNDGSGDSTTAGKASGWTNGFLQVAVDVLRVKNCKDEVARDIMMCTLSHLFCWEHAFEDFPQRNSILKFCTATMTKSETNEFSQETCLWILWGLLLGADATNQSKSLMSGATEVIKNVMSEHEHCPNIITLGLAVLADLAFSFGVSDADSLIEPIFHLKAENEKNEILNNQANRLLTNICKTEDTAKLIECKCAESTSFTMSCSTAINLAYKVSTLTDINEFSVDDLKDAIETWRHSDGDCYLAAKVLFLITEESNAHFYKARLRNTTSGDILGGHNRVTLLRKAQAIKGDKFVDLAIEYMKDVIESTTNEDLLLYTCQVIRHVAILAQVLQLKNLNVSLVLGAILGAQIKGVNLPQLHAIWALVTLDCELQSSLLNDLSQLLIDLISDELSSSIGVVSTGIAVLSIILPKSKPILETLGRNTIERGIEVVIKVMYECLDLTGNNPEIFLYGLKVLLSCSHDNTLHDCIVKHGGIVAIIDGMNVNYDNVPILEEGCKILRHLSTDNMETQVLLIEADIVDTALNILITHGVGTNPGLISDVFDIISIMCISKYTRAFIAAQGGLMLITQSMSALYDDSSVQEKGLIALANLVSDIENDVIEMMDISSTLIASMEHHLVERRIQKLGLSILQNLSMRSNGIKDQMILSGSVDTVITAITIHMVCTIGVRYSFYCCCCCCCLWSTDNIELFTQSQSKIVATSFSILLNLSNEKQCIISLRQSDTLQLIGHSMMVNIQCLKTQRVGCRLLLLLPSVVKSTRGTTFVEAVTYAMMYHFSSEDIQLSGCKLFTFCSRQLQCIDDDSNLDNMIVEAVISSMEQFPRLAKMQEVALEALENISTRQKLMNALRSHSSRIIPAVNNAMSLSESIEVFERGSDILAKLL